ncbi:MAG TPA: cytochrome c oxidase subunit II, partial [Tepidisphaeraceae bacterium]|nr:cytochrome c oxidase subunit II [Tepidisphaeraceae bacterium]
MAQLLPFSPPAASNVAKSIDLVFGIELACATFVVVLIAGLMLYFSFRYRRRSHEETPPRIATHNGLEVLWTTATFALFTFFFFMGAGLYVHIKKPLKNAQEVYVVGKQWMWKIQHADGLREIDELHVPVGQPIQLVMTSEDVIHDFFIPAFRLKMDVIPGSYTSEWFTATEPGTYHLFCSQYCGMNHSLMVGHVIVLTQADYNAWRAGLGPTITPAQSGRQ